MRANPTRIWGWWVEAWRGDPFESDLPMQGEHRVARVRLLTVGALTLVNAAVVAIDPANPDFAGSLPINAAALALALIVLLATRRGNRPRLLSLVTVVADISAVSLLQVHDLVRGLPSVVLNSRVTFSAYFLAMVGTCIRFNPRLALFGGAVAATQYAGLAVWGASIWPGAPTDDVVQHGLYDWGVQAERVVTLLVFGGICASIASWAVSLRSTATHDALTGLLNRRTFEEQLHGEALRSQRQARPIAVAMIDVDHFKRVNDTHGHHAGDLALVRIAALLRDTVRRTDLAGRWGGEEFVLLFPAGDGVSTASHIERLRARVAEMAIELPGGEPIALTISAGVAAGPDDGVDGAALIRVADARLLEAKRAGRNRVVLSGACDISPTVAPPRDGSSI